MRRGSIVGPVILIVIGAVFLLNNIRPDLSVLDMLASYWPFLLIVLGLLRLIEIFVSMNGGTRVLPERGISGGEWVLVVFLCVVGSGAFFFHRNIGRWPPNSIRAKII